MNPFKTLKTIESAKLQNLFTLFATGLLFWISMTSLLPTLPTYIEDIGGTIQDVGLVMGCFAIGLLLSRNWLGILADRRGRKLLILIGTVVVGLAPLGYLFAKSIPVLMILRAFHGISIAAFTTGYSALVVDLSPIKQRGELIGYMSLAVPVGMAIGPALGGFLQQSTGYTPLFLVSATSGFLAFLLANQVKEDTTYPTIYPHKTTANKPNRSFWQLLSSPSLLVPTMILLLIGLLFGTLATFFPLFVRQIDPHFNIGLFYTVAAIASFAVRIFTGRASDLYGRGLFISLSLVCYALSMLLLFWATTPEAFLMAAIFEGSGGGLLIPMILALLSDRSLAHERAQVFAICTSGFDVGIAIAGPILGYLTVAIALGYREMFALAGSLAIVALLLFFTQSNKNISYSFRFALGQEKDFYALEE
ncbi:MAG: MFS transporter [Microcystaceae cyanobacterium]